jgi:prepilin-type N-terminal cleavage/methylation domain-containing protein
MYLIGRGGMEVATLSCIMNPIPKSRLAKGKSGFTMMELMIAIAIIGILAAIGIPAFTVWLPNYRLKVATGDVYSALQFAKSTAIKENADVVIWFNTANNSYRAYLDNGEGGGTASNRTQDGSEKTIRNGTMEAGIDMYDTLFSSWSNQTVFDGRGLASGGWGYVSLKNNENKYKRVTVWTTGHLKIQNSSDGSSWS